MKPQRSLVSTAIHNDDKHVYPSEIKRYDAYKLFVVLYCRVPCSSLSLLIVFLLIGEEARHVDNWVRHTV